MIAEVVRFLQLCIENSNKLTILSKLYANFLLFSQRLIASQQPL